MQVLGASTTEERWMREKEEKRRPNADVASETPERREEPVGCSGTNNL
jgi:hypothetical protein